MTISSTANRVSYTGNGVTTIFSFPYKFLVNADLVVYLDGVVQAITTNYTVTGAGLDGGGSVTFLVAPVVEAEVVILRDPAVTQSLDLVENDPLPAEEVENALDKQVMISQRLKDRVDRALVVSDSDTSVVDYTIPAVVADGILKFNHDADAMEILPIWEIGGIPLPVIHGAWSSATAYVIFDIVELSGSSYICKVANTNQPPPNTAFWELLASKGNDGAAGAGSGDASTNTSSSVDNELALFSGTAGKTLKRSGSTGVPYLTSGVVSTATGSQLVAAIGSFIVENADKLDGQHASEFLTKQSGNVIDSISIGTPAALPTVGTSYSASTAGLSGYTGTWICIGRMTVTDNDSFGAGPYTSYFGLYRKVS
jgi:hypothetical protein